jgi:tripeptidyl-peptidase-1
MSQTPGDNEPYVEFLAGILVLPDSALPQTLSISYGEDEQSWPIDMAKSVCNGFIQLGARGVSVMFTLVIPDPV